MMMTPVELYHYAKDISQRNNLAKKFPQEGKDEAKKIITSEDLEKELVKNARGAVSNWSLPHSQTFKIIPDTLGYFCA